MRNFKFSDLQKFILLDTTMKNVYKDGVDTHIPEAIVCNVVCTKGNFKILLQPQKGLLDTINSNFGFGQQWDLEEVFNVEDITVALYKDDIIVKVFAEFKEGIL